MGRGSPICVKECVQIFWNTLKTMFLNVKFQKALQISSSTVHTIIKRFRESGEISVHKGQGRRPLLDARGLRCQLKTFHGKRKPYVNMIQKRRRVLWIWKWIVSKWKSVLWSDESKFDIFVGNHRRRVRRAKEEGDLPACHQRSVQKPASLMVWGCIGAYGMGSLHVL